MRITDQISAIDTSDPRNPCNPRPSLYGCIRSPRLPDLPIAIARDFSPRWQRRGRAGVVLDLAGLERLLGDARAIGAELDRACEARCADRAALAEVSIALAPTQMGALLLAASRPPSREALRPEPAAPKPWRPEPVTPEPSPRRHGPAAPKPWQGLAAPKLWQGLAAPKLWQGLAAPKPWRRREPAAPKPWRRRVSRDLAAALAPLSLDVLRQVLAEMHDATVLRSGKTRPARRTAAMAEWEAYERAFAIFERWGLATLSDLAGLPGGDLASRLGQEGVALQLCARGIDRGPLVPDPDVPRFLERMELEWSIDGLEPLAFVLARLLEPLSLALERADRGAAAIRLQLRLVDRTEHARLLQLPAAIRDPRVLRTLLVLDLESHPPPAAIDVVTIEIDPAPARIVQYSLLERARPSVETLATLIARLGALSGESRVGSARLLDSHEPDGFAMCPFAPGDEGAALASLPRRTEGAKAGSIALRRYRPPIAIRVAVEHGRPVRVAIDRKSMPGGRVDQCAGPWRSSGAWWDHDARQWSRDEWDLALSDGSVCRVFRDHGKGLWFMEAVID